MKWSEEAWLAAENTYSEIMRLPFIRELADGSLSKDRFTYYLQQDALYLKEYGRILSVIAGRMPDSDARKLFMRLAEENLEAERQLHDMLMQDGPAAAVEASPACRLCCSRLNGIAAESPVETALASILPCFVVYEKAGRHIYEACISGDGEGLDNPYRNWIDTYSGDGFSRSTEMLADLCDSLAETCPAGRRMEMTEAFVSGVKMELLFWQSAYAME